ncbi:MAG TPA: MSMEG_0567/sll0787 family protein [Streptosporangiaceae bacterium]|nr:MSMEG_0567/sll0787 family protein [Streptosporangiaceae bacterium]
MFEVLTGERRETVAAPPPCLIEVAGDPATVAAYRALRTRVFVTEQGLFGHSDADDRDDDPRTVVLVARAPDGTVIGGVRLGPAGPGPDLGWWQGGRLVVDPAARRGRTGVALVRAACTHAEQAGALRFDATVQPAQESFFRRLGWQPVRAAVVAGHPHVLMRYPIGRLAGLAAQAKSRLGGLLAGLGDAGPGDGLLSGAGRAPGGAGFRGDDGAPVPGTDVVAACDAIVPSMVERDPHWAGWCSVLVNVNDLAAMGATPVGLLDAVGARDASFAARVLAGLRQAATAYGVPVLGGHTQLGVPAALAVTALGRTADPVPGGGGRPGHRVRITADLGGGWRPGYRGRQWDSTTTRRAPELGAMLTSVAAARPAAAKDVSMAGMAGTLGMLAEASGCGAVLDVARVPRPAGATTGDWLSCFPGFAMITTAAPADDRPLPAGPAVSAECGELRPGRGVTLRWPDGECTEVITGPVTGLGPA